MADKSQIRNAAFVTERWDQSRKAMRYAQYNYALNSAFLSGDQWVTFDTARQTVTPIPRHDSRVRATVNRLWPASRHIISRLLSRELVFECPPKGPDDASVQGAKLAQSILMATAKEHKWEGFREDIAWNTWLGGTSVLALDWDSTAGTPLMQDDNRTVGTGDVTESALNVLEVAWEPGVRDAELGFYWIRGQALPPDEVQMRYRLSAKPAADASAATSVGVRKFQTTDNGGGIRPELTMVLTYYERPNPTTPQGVVMTVVGNKVVDGPHPWPFPFKDRLNMTVFRETKIPGQALGETILSAAVPIQTAYNAAFSNIIEHLKLAGNARLFIPEGSIDDIDEFTDTPGEGIPVNMGAGAPFYLTPANLPTWVMNMPTMLSEQLDDILGLHDVSRGVAPNNVASGVGLSVLVEQDTTPLGGLTRELARGFERFASLVLQVYETRVVETRHAVVAGEVVQNLPWTGASLHGQTVVDVPLDQVMPRSRAASWAMAREMWDRKLTTDPREFARIADLPDQRDFLSAIDPDVAKAVRENAAMAQGKAVLPAAFDDHAKHIPRHNTFRKSTAYDALSDEEKAICDQHIQAHEVMAAEEAGKQMAKALAHPAMATLPTAHEAAPLPPGAVPPGAEGSPFVDAPGQVPAQTTPTT